MLSNLRKLSYIHLADNKIQGLKKNTIFQANHNCAQYLIKSNPQLAIVHSAISLRYNGTEKSDLHLKLLQQSHGHVTKL